MTTADGLLGPSLQLKNGFGKCPEMYGMYYP
jgi:hypothetical protein